LHWLFLRLMKKFLHTFFIVILSFSIVTPSLISLKGEHYDIEISKDLGEEDSTKDSKNELKEQDTFLEIYVIPELALQVDTKVYNNAYQLEKSSFLADIQVPPPQTFI